VAGKSFRTIDVIDLSEVWGGSDKQTEAAKLALAQATGAVEDVAKTVGPKDTGMTDALLRVMNQRGSGRGNGPNSAPALPPTSTLTR